MKLEKRMMTLLLKGLVIIGLFGNGLMAYADEPDNYGTWYEQIEALESLKKQLLLWLEQEQADANKYGFDASAHTDAWKKLENQWQQSEWHLLRTLTCQTQLMETFDKQKAGHFIEAMPLYQQLIDGNCPDQVIRVAQYNVCLMRYKLAIDKNLAGDFTGTMKLYQQIIEKNCPNKLVISAQLCKTQYKQAEKQQQAGNLTEALQSYQQMIETDCQEKRMILAAFKSLFVEIGPTYETQHRFDLAIETYKKALFLADQMSGKVPLIPEERLQTVKEYICVIRSQQAKKQENIGNFNQALHLYQQVLKEDCQVKKLVKKKLCLIPFELAKKQAKAGHLEKALRLYQQALNSCQDIGDMIASVLLLIKIDIVSAYETQQRFDKAIDIFRTALAMAEKPLRAEHLVEKRQILKTELCLMQYQQAERLRKENPLSEKALQFYQQVLDGNCQRKRLIISTLSSLINMGIAPETEKSLDKAIKTLQKVLGFVEKNAGTEYITNEMRQTLTEQVCLMQYQQAEENVNEQVKNGHITEALQFYRQVLAEKECQGNKRMTEFVAKKICSTLSLYAQELREADDFSKASSLYQQVLEEHCQNNDVYKEFALVSIVDMGLNRETQKIFEKAFEFYQKALSLTNKHFGSEHYITGIVLHRMANVYYSQADYARAKTLWEKALVINEKVYGAEHPLFADTLTHLAKIDYSLANYSQAESRLKRAKTIYETHYRSEYTEATDFVFTLASLYTNLGDYKSVESLLTSVVDDCEKALASENQGCLLIQESLSEIYLAQGESTKSQSVLKKVRDIKEKLYGLESPDVTETLSNLAHFYSSNGDYAKAESLLQRVLRIRKKSYPAEHPDIADIQSILATTVYTKLGDYGQAEWLLRTALAIYTEASAPQRLKIAETLNNLAAIDQKQGDYGQAKSRYQAAMVIEEQAYGPQHPKVADTINKLALVYQQIGDNAYGQALNLYRPPVDIHGGIDILNELEKAYESLGYYAHTQAKLLFERVLAIDKKVYGSQHVYVSVTNALLAEVYQRLGDYTYADSLLLQAWSIAVSNNSQIPRLLSPMQMNLGNLLARQNNYPAAIFFAKQAINVLQKLRGKLPPRDKTLQRSFIKDNAEPFKILIRLLIEQNRLPEALQVIQMYKEEEYFDFVHRDTAADGRTTQVSYTDLEQQWVSRYAQITQQLAELASEKRDLERQAKPGDLTEAQKGRIAKLESAMTETSTAFLEELKTAFKQAQETNMVVVRKTPSKAQQNLTELQNTLRELGHEAVLVYYFILEDQLMTMLVTPDEQIVREVAISEKELHRQIDDFIEILQDEEEDQEQAQVLYNILIKPIAKHLAKVPAKTLMVSLDGTLRYLPIAALHDGQQYMVERYAIVRYTQAAKNTLQRPPKSTQWRIAGLGVSEKVRDEFEALNEVDEELEQIVRRDNNDQDGVLPGVIYLNNQFTAQKMQQVLSENYTLLHIASHFELTATDLSSFLLLGDGTKLQLATIREDYHFNGIDLLTLSACETAIGIQTANGKEIEGFAVLAQNNGAGGVLATLWTVDSASTSQFMPAFYRQLTDQNLTLSKAEALQQVQKAFIQTDEYAHPFYWAPFILMGNWL